MFNRLPDGLYWDKAWSLVSGCTPLSAACDNNLAECWKRYFITIARKEGY